MCVLVFRRIILARAAALNMMNALLIEVASLAALLLSDWPGGGQHLFPSLAVQSEPLNVVVTKVIVVEEAGVFP